MNSYWIHGRLCKFHMYLYTMFVNTIVSVRSREGDMYKYWHNTYYTRLHSSRMHTARLLTVSPSMHCAGGVSALGGCLLWGVVCSWGCLLPGYVCLGGGIPACTEAERPCEQNSWHMLLKILPCPKHRLQPVKIILRPVSAQEFLNV